MMSDTRSRAGGGAGTPRLREPDPAQAEHSFGVTAGRLHGAPSAAETAQGLRDHRAAASSAASCTSTQLSSWDEFARGALAAGVNIFVTFPLHKAMFRQQVSGSTFRSALRDMMGEGVVNAWRGVVPPLVQRAAAIAVMFGTYKVYTEALLDAGFAETSCSIIAGAASGVSEAMLAPLERVQTLLQHRDFNNRVRSTRHAFQLLRPHGVRELYRGGTTILFRCVASNMLFFSLRQPVRDSMCRWLQKLSPAPGEPCSTASSEERVSRPILRFRPFHMSTRDVITSFVSGGLLGAVIGYALYPASVTKVIMQSNMGGQPYVSALTTIRALIAERGVRKLMAGSGTNFVRSCLSWGLMNTCYEAMSPTGFGYPSTWLAALTSPVTTSAAGSPSMSEAERKWVEQQRQQEQQQEQLAAEAKRAHVWATTKRVLTPPDATCLADAEELRAWQQRQQKAQDECGVTVFESHREWFLFRLKKAFIHAQTPF